MDQLLAPGRFGLGEHVRNWWVASIEKDTQEDALLDPAFWANFAVKMRPYDIIEARKDDGTYWAMFLVLGCDRTYAKIHKLYETSLSSRDVSLIQDKFLVEWGSPTHKYRVIRKNDGAVLHKGCDRKADAEAWLEENRQAIS